MEKKDVKETLNGILQFIIGDYKTLKLKNMTGEYFVLFCVDLRSFSV